MIIYGLAIVALVMYIGSFLGYLLGAAVGINGNIGGVGIAMFLLIIFTSIREKKKLPFNKTTEDGIRFLSSLYIPIVVAMAMRQDVVKAVSGGWVAFLAGGLATVGGILLVPVVVKIFVKNSSNLEENGGQ